MSRTVRISLTGTIGAHVADALGGWIEEADTGSVFVARYVDQAQLAGLLAQFSNAHLNFDQVAIHPATGPTPLTPTNQGATQ